MASGCPLSPGVARKREGFAREWAGSVPTRRGQVKKRSEGAGVGGTGTESPDPLISLFPPQICLPGPLSAPSKGVLGIAASASAARGQAGSLPPP